MTTLADIEALAREFSEARRKLADAVADLEEEVRRLKRRRLPQIRRLVDRAATARAELHAAVEAAPELFRRPRTVVFHGVRIGWSKGRGEIRFEDPARVVELIRRHYPERFDELVKTSWRPIKPALSRLSVAELRRIGVTVVETGDQVVIAPQDSEVDRLVDALLRDGEEELREAAE